MWRSSSWSCRACRSRPTSTSRAIGLRSRPIGGVGRPGRFESGARIELTEEPDQGLVGSERTCTVRCRSRPFRCRGSDSSPTKGPVHARPRPSRSRARGRQSARGTAGPRRDDELGPLGRLDDQGPRHDERGDLGVAELLQQSEDIAIDRLAPDVVAVVEVTADADGLDPRVERRGVERDRPSLRRSRRSLRAAPARVPGAPVPMHRPARAPSGPRSRSGAGPVRRPIGRRTRGW